MTTTDRLRRKELERLAASLERIADAASRDFTPLFFSRRKGRPMVRRAKGAEGKSASAGDRSVQRPDVRARKGGAQ